MTKKLTIAILVTAMLISLLMIIVAISAAQQKKRVTAQNIADLPKETQPVTTLVTRPETGYYLKEYQGEIAVFRGDSPTPFRLLGVSVSYMTDEDKILLGNGIFAKDERALRTLIEDYTS